MAKRKIKTEDLRKIKFVSDPQISPEGNQVAYVLSTINHKEDKYDRHIWINDTIKGKNFQFTYGIGNDTFPRWSHNGDQLLFLSKGREQDKKTQLYTISADGGEAQLHAETELRVSNPKWSPCSRNILFTSKVWTDQKPKTDVKKIKRIRYKVNNVGFFQGRRSHLFIYKERGKPKQLTKGEFDVESASWSTCGEKIAFITNMQDDADTSRVRDIYIISSKGGKPKKITKSDYAITSLSHSPDGQNIAFIGYDKPHELAVDYQIFIMPSDGGEKNNLTESFPRSLEMKIGSDLRVASPTPGAVWSFDSEWIYFVTADTPFSNIYRINVKDTTVECVIYGKSIDSFSLNKDCTKIAYNAMSSVRPHDLFIFDDKETRITKFNDSLLDSLIIIKPEHFTFTNRLNREVDGWMIKPVDFKESKKYPCILEMHGGPRGIYGDGIFQEFQLLAAQNYVVIYTNPRGSAGYEEEYTQAVMRHYGEVDYEDFMDFTDEAIKRYSWIDDERLGLLGGSYGGYTTNWIISHTNRFKAAVTFRSICNWVSKFGVSDIGFMQPESISGRKTYWQEDLIEQMKHSPLYYANQVNTPCLIIHSEEDYRCPMDQAEQWFTALKLNKVPTQLIRFPEENHDLSRSGKPKHREERFHHMLRWFKEYL
jgi:dipeptidyl aminopeptidase/acylaminoacyl peptidase